MAGTLACDKCYSLVYSRELDTISAEAKSLESQGKYLEAREQWMHALPLLPKSAKQAEWIEERAKQLNALAAKQQSQGETKWAKRVGPLGVLGAILLKGKTILFALFKLKFLLSFASFIAIYWALWGPIFGIGFAAMILIHELGHYIDVQRRGLPAEAPVFIPGLMAYVKWDAMGVPLDVRAEVSLAGPLAGFIAALACAGYFVYSGNPLFAALARAGAWLNVLNLIPVWAFDGGSATNALSKVERGIVLGCSAALWLLTGEVVFFLVGAGFVYRLFTHDLPAAASPKTTVYYIVVLALLAAVMWAMPGAGAGIPR
jgi:Zn-dependent protease